MTHEGVHMGINYLRRVKLNALALRKNVDNREEDLCYAVGTCARQVVDQFYRRGVY